MTPGPIPGSKGAQAVSAAHKGAREHDKTCGFASNTERASIAGKIGGNRVKAKYGMDYYREIGKRGGGACRNKYGSTFYAEIGRKGAFRRHSKGVPDEALE